ncbi:MAG: prephenate dehydrogenase [Candidatus Acidiferrum sp.]|jgi:prephenate dehydrogenase
MPNTHLIERVAILGTGLIGGSFALALKKYAADLHITGWDRSEVAQDAKTRGAVDVAHHGDLAPAVANADLIYMALPISATLDLLPEVAKHAAPRALITDACSTKLRIVQSAAETFHSSAGPLFLAGHPMAGRELSGLTHADADLFQHQTYALISVPPAGKHPGEAAGLGAGPSPGASTVETVPLAEPSDTSRDPRVNAFVKLLEKIGARPLWLGAQQHDYAVGLVSHLPQLAAIALASFLYDRLDENGLPITLSGPGLRDSLRLAGSPYAIWRDIILTNREILSAELDLFARRLDDLRDRLNSRELEADFDAANELYKLLRSL